MGYREDFIIDNNNKKEIHKKKFNALNRRVAKNVGRKVKYFVITRTTN